MSSRAKYIVVEHTTFPGTEYPVIFAETLLHKQVAGTQKVISAGFCSVSGYEVAAWGESTSLGIKSRGDMDATLLRKWLTDRNPVQAMEARGVEAAKC